MKAHYWIAAVLLNLDWQTFVITRTTLAVMMLSHLSEDIACLPKPSQRLTYFKKNGKGTSSLFRMWTRFKWTILLKGLRITFYTDFTRLLCTDLFTVNPALQPLLPADFNLASTDLVWGGGITASDDSVCWCFMNQEVMLMQFKINHHMVEWKWSNYSEHKCYTFFKTLIIFFPLVFSR